MAPFSICQVQVPVPSDMRSGVSAATIEECASQYRHQEYEVRKALGAVSSLIEEEDAATKAALAMRKQVLEEIYADALSKKELLVAAAESHRQAEKAVVLSRHRGMSGMSGGSDMETDEEGCEVAREVLQLCCQRRRSTKGGGLGERTFLAAKSL
eukprot:TRINITY_DN47405_c0_g1_i1.p1 TRINITY_DN47405_c0_g1~~TRINITY_DN47405_c0_g1_i1.p1  ORF type:complete len:181 (-),score=39.19 TRINITY_DN47405_c0_g1_i1:153-617(-)